MIFVTKMCYFLETCGAAFEVHISIPKLRLDESQANSVIIRPVLTTLRNIVALNLSELATLIHVQT